MIAQLLDKVNIAGGKTSDFAASTLAPIDR